MSIYVKTYPITKPETYCAQRGYIGLSLSNRITGSELLLTQIFEWGRENLASFDILIGDYVYRHNLEDLDGLSQSAAINKAMTLGRDTARHVQGVLDVLGLSSVKLLFASDLYKRPLFVDYLKAKNELYESSTQFQHQIRVASEDFFRRFAPSRIHTEKAIQHSRNYQLEELALFELLADDGYSVNVYPGAHLPIMKDIVTGSYSETIPKLHDLILIELRFRSMQ